MIVLALCGVRRIFTAHFFKDSKDTIARMLILMHVAVEERITHHGLAVKYRRNDTRKLRRATLPSLLL
jgi:hypothetical protein